MTTLQTYILHLRKLLASLNRLSLDEVALRLLVTKPGGYAFHSNAAWLDLHEFEGRFAAGKAAFASGQDAQAARELNSRHWDCGTGWPWLMCQWAGCSSPGYGNSTNGGSSRCSTWSKPSSGSACITR